MNALRGKWHNFSGRLGMSLVGFIALMLAGCGGGGGATSPTPTTTPAPTTTPTTTATIATRASASVVLVSIDITPVLISMLPGSTIDLTATGTYNNGTTVNLTSQVTWTSTSTGIATISAAGVATAVSTGNSIITASTSGLTSPAASITVIAGTSVTLTGVNISPATVTAPPGQIVTFVVMGTFADFTTDNVSGSALWSSSNPSVATVSSNGTVTTLTAGSTTITASVGAFSSAAVLTVSVPIATGPLSGVTWTYTPIDRGWWRQVADPYAPGGGSVFKASQIWNGESTTASVTVNILAAGNVSFYYKVNSEVNFDHLIFTIDGVEPAAARWSGYVPWALASYPITAGPHILRWQYAKDWGYTWGLDTAWISQVSIPAVVSAVTPVGTQMGGARQGVPLVLSTAVTTLAGSGLIGGTDGLSTEASFYQPNDITTDGINLYVADSLNNNIRKIEIATGVVASLAGHWVRATGSSDGIGTAATFFFPQGITTDGASLYVTDYQNNKIRKIAPASGSLSAMTQFNAVVTTLAGSGAIGAVDGTGVAASFYYPVGITTDGINLYVADFNNHNIRKIVIATGAVTTLAGTGVAGSVDGTGTAASFNKPSGLTTDGTSLYVADRASQKIRKIAPASGSLSAMTSANAVVTTLAGSGVKGAVDGIGLAALFWGPRRITTDGTSLYVADMANNKIRKIVPASGSLSAMTSANAVVTTLAGSGTMGAVDGTGAAASFYYPIGITTDSVSLFVADINNNKIRKIQ